jgi:hypothetical protein
MVIISIHTDMEQVGDFTGMRHLQGIMVFIIQDIIDHSIMATFIMDMDIMVVITQHQIGHTDQVELDRTIQGHKVRLGVAADIFQDRQHRHVVAVPQEVVDISVEEGEFWELYACWTAE